MRKAFINDPRIDSPLKGLRLRNVWAFDRSNPDRCTVYFPEEDEIPIIMDKKYLGEGWHENT